jgi:glycosyltransferase involved in cell wall biosynthesis
MDKNDVKVSFTILTHNETDSLKNLLNQIASFKTLWDEVIIVDDYSTTPKTNEILDWAKNDDNIHATIAKRELAGDFASQKNFANSLCKNDYIFNIDSDELLDDNLSKSFREIIAINPDIEYFRLPRVNKVEGLTIGHASAWRWQISSLRTEIEDKALTPDSEEFKLIKMNNLIIQNDNGMIKFYTPIINWPDMQGRIYKKLPQIQWVNKVHEVVIGYKKYSLFPQDKKFSLLHYKSIQLQESQNNFYSTIR